MKQILQGILKHIAVAVLKKYRPRVVGITGSVGKTSTALAVALVLSARYRVGRNIKNYNNEFGIPLSILGCESGGHSVLGWLKVFLVAARLLLIRDSKYPAVLVLEMGADHPGDISYLTSFAPLEVGIVTAVAEAHLEFFDTLERVAKEKGMLVRGLPKTGRAILNYDDPRVQQMRTITKAPVTTFGMSDGADIRALEVNLSRSQGAIQGVSFKIKYEGVTISVLLPNVCGEHLVGTALAAMAVGVHFDINLHDAAEQLKKFQPPLGRMHLIDGIKGTLIIDDTYNASPLATAKAVYQLSKMRSSNKSQTFAVLGDMLELGRMSEQAHTDIGTTVAQYKIDYLVTAGELPRDMVRGAMAAGMSEDRCFNFDDAIAAGKFVQDRISQGDIVLVEGSQGMRMERVVKEIMAQPEQARELLVRQDKSWQ